MFLIALITVSTLRPLKEANCCRVRGICNREDSGFSED